MLTFLCRVGGQRPSTHTMCRHGHREVPETAFASLNSFSCRTTNMSHVGRHNIVEVSIESQAINKRKTTDKTMVNMMKKTTKAQEEAQSERGMAIQ